MTLLEQHDAGRVLQGGDGFLTVLVTHSKQIWLASQPVQHHCRISQRCSVISCWRSTSRQPTTMNQHHVHDRFQAKQPEQVRSGQQLMKVRQAKRCGWRQPKSGTHTNHRVPPKIHREPQQHLQGLTSSGHCLLHTLHSKFERLLDVCGGSHHRQISRC
eukprot:1144964-Pelagomonas_calceolata.AAC.3